MSNFGEIITTVAVAAFMLSLCLVDGNPVLAFSTMFISGAWIIGYHWWQEEERIYRMKERER